MNEENPMIEQKESIKLIKNSRGYNWEIKLLDLNLKRLEELNNQMQKKFNIELKGGKKENG